MKDISLQEHTEAKGRHTIKQSTGHHKQSQRLHKRGRTDMHGEEDTVEAEASLSASRTKD